MLHVVRAEVKDSDALGASDPYYVVNLGGESDGVGRVYKSEVLQNTVRPDWNEKRFYLLTEDCKSFSVKVYDKDAMSSDLLGEVKIDREPLRHKERREERRGGWMDLGRNCGRIELYYQEISIHNLEKAADDAKHIYSENDIKQNDEFLLYVSIQSASGLRKADLNGYSDPYAVVSFSDAKDAIPRELRTQVVNESLNPVFNWQGMFLIRKSLQNFRVELFDKDTMSDDSLGHVNLALPDEPFQVDDRDFMITRGKGSVRVKLAKYTLTTLFSGHNM